MTQVDSLNGERELKIGGPHRRLLFILIITSLCRIDNTIEASAITNLALGEPISSSSAALDHPAALAVDGEDHTYWESKENGRSSHLVIHLGRRFEIDRVVLPLFSGFEALTIHVWKESSWSQVFEGKTSAQVLFGFAPAVTDKVRLLLTGSPSARIHEIQVYAADPQPVFVNQSGYNFQWPKRFTAPRAEDGSAFHLTLEQGSDVLYRGRISGRIGDFSDFEPEDPGPYIIAVEGNQGLGQPVPFNIGPYWLERVSYQPAIDFMIDSRCWWGDARDYSPTDDCADCPEGGVAWRDGAQYSFEVPSLIQMYQANPSAFSIDRMPVQGPYLGLRHQLPADTPEIIRLIYWGVDILLRGQADHALLKEQLAYFIYAYPIFSEYIPRSVYEEARDYLFAVWGKEEFKRWEDIDFGFGEFWSVSHTADLLQTYTVVGTGKGQFPPGHSVIPNLMMYEVALRENRSDAHRYFKAAHDQTAWIIDHADWADPRMTKGQRMSERITLEALSYFLRRYPEKAPPGLRTKIRTWAEIMIARSENIWDFRRYSEDRWVIPSIRPPDHPSHATRAGFNEPGNVAGFPVPALAAASVLEEQGIKQRLRQLAVAHVDNVFGRNPTGRHFSYDGASDFEGVELGWFKEYQGGAGRLQSARGVLDGSPKETTYPFDPHAGDPGHTEGWVTFNTAWNAALAYLSSHETQIEAFDKNFTREVDTAQPDQTIGVRLRAPLNFDYSVVEAGAVRLEARGSGDRYRLTVHEDSVNAMSFQGVFRIEEGEAIPGDDIPQVSRDDTVQISYGYDVFEALDTVRVNKGHNTDSR